MGGHPGQAGGVECSDVDSKDGDAVAGIAGEISAIPDPPPAPSAVGCAPATGEGVGHVSNEASPRRPTGFGQGFLDDSVASGKKGALSWGRPSGTRGQKSWPLPLLTSLVAGNSWIRSHNLFAHGMPYAGCNLQRMWRRRSSTESSGTISATKLMRAR
jgi:hypothetical protein